MIVKSNKRLTIAIIVASVTMIISVIIFFSWLGISSNIKHSITTKPSNEQRQAPKEEAIKQPIIIKPSFNKSEYSVTSPDSLWVVVNKQNQLSPVDYYPTDLVVTNGATISQKAQLDFENLINDSVAQGIQLRIVSSYRSYSNQSAIYSNYVSIYGQGATDTFSARPGYSEHQTGLAIDFGSSQQSTCNFDDCFGQTVEGLWLVNNAGKYGFLLRYPSDKQNITGYKFEPWHFRYVGQKLTIEMSKQKITTLEEFFNINGGETYL